MLDSREDEWISARKAVLLLQERLGIEDGAARHVIVDRAAAGLIHSKCRRSDNDDQHRADNHAVGSAWWRKFTLSLNSRANWSTGDFQLWEYNSRIKCEVATYVYGVTFLERDLFETIGGEPAGTDFARARAKSDAINKEFERLLALGGIDARPALFLDALSDLPSPRATVDLPTGAPVRSQPNSKTQSKPKGPGSEVRPDPSRPVSEAHLEAWWAFYRKVRAEHEQSEEDAIAHFDQCFPDKSVTRNRIRGLRGRQKSGPKAKPAE
jgi:hypothetical protein